MLRKFTLFLGTLCFLFGGAHLFAIPHQPPHEIPPAGIILGDGEHLLCGKSRDGKIELHNGAQFKVLPGEVEKVMQEWDYYDHLAFSPNPYPFGGSNFYVTNLTRGGFVHAEYWAGPRFNNIYTLTIHHIDPYYGEIYLIDSHKRPEDRTITRWIIEPKDWEHIKRWERGETVIVGLNSNWFAGMFSSHPFILVSYENFQFVKYVRASPQPL